MVTPQFWVNTSFSPCSKPQRTLSTPRLFTRLRPRLNPKLRSYDYFHSPITETLPIFIFFFIVFTPFSSLASKNVLNELKNKDPSIRLHTLDLIEKNKLHDEETILSLIEVLKDPVIYIQSEAMFLLENIGKAAVPSLLKYMASDHRSQKWRILHLLAKNNVREIIPVLKENIKRGHDEGDMPLFNASLYTLGLLRDTKEVPFIVNIGGGSPMAVMALRRIAKKDLRHLFKEVYSMDKFYKTLEENIRAVIENLNLTSQAILSLFNERDPAYQAGALLILRILKARGVATFFEAGLYRNNPTVQFQAILGIGEYKIRHLVPKLFPFLQSGSLEIIQRAAYTSIFKNFDQLTTGEKRSLENEMMSWLKSKAPSHHNLAVRALAKLQSKKAEPYLIHQLNNTHIDTSTQQALIQYIGNMAPNNAEAILLSFLSQPKIDPNTEATVLEALFQLKSKKLATILIEKLKNEETSADTKIKAIQLLGLLAPPQVEHAIFPYLNIRTYTPSVLKALIQLKHPYIEPLLISFLTHPEPEIKKVSVQELGKLKSKKSVNFLIQNLSSGNSDLTHEIIYSLAQIGDGRALLPITMTLLNSKDAITIQKAIEALAYFKEPSSAQYLMPFLKHENDDIRNSAAKALKNIRI